MTYVTPRFRVHELESAILSTAWRTWIESITEGYFGQVDRLRPRYQAIAVAGVATGLVRPEKRWTSAPRYAQRRTGAQALRVRPGLRCVGRLRRIPG